MTDWKIGDHVRLSAKAHDRLAKSPRRKRSAMVGEVIGLEHTPRDVMATYAQGVGSHHVDVRWDDQARTVERVSEAWLEKI